MKIAGIEGPPPSGEVDQRQRLGSIAPQQERLNTDGAPTGVLPIRVRLDNLERVPRLPRHNLGLPFGKLGGQRFLLDRRQRLDRVLLGQRRPRRQKRHDQGQKGDQAKDRDAAAGSDHRDRLLDRGVWQ